MYHTNLDDGLSNILHSKECRPTPFKQLDYNSLIPFSISEESRTRIFPNWHFVMSAKCPFVQMTFLALTNLNSQQINIKIYNCLDTRRNVLTQRYTYRSVVLFWNTYLKVATYLSKVKHYTNNHVSYNRFLKHLVIPKNIFLTFFPL